MAIARIEHVSLPYLRHPAWWATLENGHQVFVVHKPGEVVHLHTLVRTGSVNETEENTGVSHFLEHLMFKGTERYPAGAFDRLLEALGARVNASTSKDWTQYYITLPRGGQGEYYRFALDLHADMLLHVLLPEAEIGPPFDPAHPQVTEKRERMVVLEEIKRSHDNPWRRAITRLTELLYPQHPYRREVLGTPAVIAGIPREAIMDYYRTWYQPSNLVTIVTGELPGEETIRDVERNFLMLNPLPVLHPVYHPDEPPTAPRVEHITLPVHVGYVLMGFYGPPSADLRAIIALDVISLILGEGMSSRLHQRLVEQMPNSPFIDAGSSHWTYRDNSSVLAYGVVQAGAVKQAFDALRGEMLRLADEPPTGSELAKAVTRLETHFAAQAETAASLSVAIADSMARMNSPANYTEYLPILHSLTGDELAGYIRQYLPVEHMCAVTVSAE